MRAICVKTGPVDVEIAGQIDVLNKFIKMKPQHSVGVSRVAAAEGGLVKAEAMTEWAMTVVVVVVSK